MNLPLVHGVPSGALVLYDAAGGTFALPYQMALSEGDLVSRACRGCPVS